ncbi:hypothetical protein PC116_g4712 [Phytophthora cactorum]|uniref:Uncharacterized protein n=1 Tax=Phytophthora cactorum TaxID=29920 RepID=A0A329SH21_9STRA|nr:hypothetical protein C6341_g1750 [Phytophthora cactorum]KAG4247582.1 hypothetical protein PC116_g4712 [Phytophthora cactorum]RAW34978.1 hypothetical protein PC110_g8728 [Phytophthora cactorum]
MKKFILQQDECGISPQLILSNMRHIFDIIKPKRGYPTLSQVTYCAMYLRKRKGTKNSVHAVKQLMRNNAFNLTGDLDKVFFFGGREDEDGYPYVGKGTDEDSFIIGVTSRALINAAVEYASASRFTLFHADATFNSAISGIQ